MASTCTLQDNTSVPACSEGNTGDVLDLFSQKRDAGVGKPASVQKSCTISASVFFLRRITGVHSLFVAPSSSTSNAILIPMAGVLSSSSVELDADQRHEKRDPLEHPGLEDDAGEESEGRNASVRRCPRIPLLKSSPLKSRDQDTQHAGAG